LPDLDVQKQVPGRMNNKARLKDRHFCCWSVQAHTTEKLLAFCITTCWSLQLKALLAVRICYF